MNRVLKLASAGLIATGLPFVAFAQGVSSTAPATPDAKAGTPAAAPMHSQESKPLTLHEGKTAPAHTTAATTPKAMKEQPKTSAHAQPQGTPTGTTSGTAAPGTSAGKAPATASDGKS